MTLESRSTKGLDQQLVRGVAWTAAAKWSSMAITQVATLLVMRQLLPDDYGLVGMAQVFLGLAMVVSEFGLGLSVVIRRELAPRQIAQVNGLALLLGFGWLAVSALAARPIGDFFDEPRLPTVVVAMSTVFVIAALRTVPIALLERQLQFRGLAWIELTQALATSLFMLALALSGFGYWTLVAGGVFGATLGSLLAIAACRRPFAWPRLGALRSVVNISTHILGSRLAWYVFSNADFLIIGKLLGKTALGSYTLGWTLAGIPVEKITASLGRVTTAVFSAVQNDASELRRYFLNLTEGLALITFPLAFGLALVARDLTLAVLGTQWEEAIAPLQILAAYAAFRSITPLLAQVLSVAGHTRFLLRLNMGMALAMPLGFWVGARWGTVGVAMAWVVVHPLLMGPSYWRVFRHLELPVRSYLRALWPAASSSAAMAAVVLGLRSLLPLETPWAALLLEVAAGALTYLAILYLVHRDRMLHALEAARMLRSG